MSRSDDGRHGSLRDGSRPISAQHWVAGRPIQERSERVLAGSGYAFDRFVDELPIASTAEVDRYVEDVLPGLAGWQVVSMERRAEVLLRVATEIESHGEDLAEVLAHTHGVEFSVAWHRLTQEVEGLRDVARGVIPPLAAERHSSGIYAIVMAGELADGLLLVALGRLLMCGSVVMVRPDPTAPLVSRLVAELATAAGLPDGVVNVVYGDDETIDAFATNPFVAGIVAVLGERRGERLMRLGEVTRKRIIVHSLRPVEQAAPRRAQDDEASGPPIA